MQRVAVVGVGGMGKVHVDAYSRMPNAELVAVCDLDMEVAQNVASKYSVAAYPSIEALLEEADIGVVDVCTPTPTHFQLVKTAAEAGKHVSCEKPLARTIGQAQEAVRVCAEAGVVLFVAQVVRWFPEFRKLHDLIAEGAVGDVVEVRTSRGGSTLVGAPKWFTDFKQSGGVALDLIVHDYDWLRWCFGNVHRVYARGIHEMNIPFTDYALVTLRFENGVIAHVEGDQAKQIGFRTSVEVAGTKGLLSCASRDSAPLHIQRTSGDEATRGIVIPESPSSVSPYFLELQHFIDCLEEGKTPDVSGEDGLEAVRIAEAAIRSMSSGEPVTLASGGNR